MSVVVITGCSSGFGRLAAERLAARGDHVFATMRDPDGKNRAPANELRAMAVSGGWKLEVLELDVTSGTSVDAAAARVAQLSEGPDVLINNAGQMYIGITEAFTTEEFAQQLSINVVGIHRVTRAFLPPMRRRGSGLIINVSSIAGRIATPFITVYNSSKWAVEGYSLGLRYELGCVGIDLVVVEPGPFSTRLFSQSPGPEDAERRSETYPAMARERIEGFDAAFAAQFADDRVPTDPTDVVARFEELIDMEPGERPFRSVVGADKGVAARNATDEVHEAAFLEMMGLTDFVQIRSK